METLEDSHNLESGASVSAHSEYEQHLESLENVIGSSSDVSSSITPGRRFHSSEQISNNIETSEESSYERSIDSKWNSRDSYERLYSKASHDFTNEDTIQGTQGDIILSIYRSFDTTFIY